MRISSDRRFRFDVAPEVLWELIGATDGYRDWWPWLRRFDGDGLIAGDTWNVLVRPPLPYSLRFSITLDEVVAPSHVVAAVRGEIEGDARLDIIPLADGGCEARLRSHLAPAHPFLRTMAAMARPVVRFGHDWVLDTGARQFVRRAMRTT